MPASSAGDVALSSSSSSAKASAALTSVPDFANPLANSTPGASGTERDGAFFAALQKNAAAKREMEEAAKKVRQLQLLADSCQRERLMQDSHALPPPFFHTPIPFCAGQAILHDCRGEGRV